MISTRQHKHGKEVRIVGFAVAVRVLRSGDVNLLQSIQHLLQMRKERRAEQREEEMQRRESARKAALIQLL